MQSLAQAFEPRRERQSRRSSFISTCLRVSAVNLVLAACLLFGSGSARADCSCGGNELEIVFLLDCSGSMNHTLGTLQEQVRRMFEALEGQVRRLKGAVVVYRTREYAGRQRKLHVLPFTSDSQALTEFLRAQTAEGGGEEIVEEALNAALNDLRWTKGARKVAVLLGDEQPREEEQARCIEKAKAFAERGIVLHTVTASQTAWIYWAPANTGSWRQQLMGMGEEAKRVFRLPHFEALAAAGGGVSVSSWNSKELVLWLLAFSLGLNEKDAKSKIDVDKYLEWAKQRDLAEGAAKKEGAAAPATAEGTGAPLIAWVRHGGEWQVPHHFGGLFEHLKGRLELAGPPRVEELALNEARLERYPVLYLSGHGPVKWKPAERDALRARLLSGGCLIADACCGDKEFTESLKGVLRELFPERALERIAAGHAIFTCGHRVEKVKRGETSRTGKMESRDPELWGLSLPDPLTSEPRLAVILSPHDLGCAWRSRPLGIPCMHADADGLALSANVIVWALTR